MLLGTNPPHHGPLPRQGECTGRLLISLEVGSHRHPARPEGLQSYRPTVRPTLGRPLCDPGKQSARPLRVLKAKPIGDCRRCLYVPDEGQEPPLLPSRLVHPWATPRGASAAGDDNSGRPRSASGMAAGSQPDAHQSSSPTTDRFHAEHRLDPPELETDLLQDLRVVCQALGRPQGYIDSVVRP